MRFNKQLKPGSEAVITRSIRQLLRLHNVFHWKVWQGLGSEPGVADIIGIYGGKPLAIEVKAEKGKDPVGVQALWLQRFKESGGIVIVARSPEEVAEALQLPGVFNYDR